jgi:putative tryptophan/tyrosine transport system substrate-binding protein
MRRREFITLLGGTAAAWPLAARAQQRERMRRVGFLHALAENDPETQARIATFREGLKTLGWVEKHNVQIEHRFSSGDFAQIHEHTVELVSSAPDLIVGSSTPVITALKQVVASRSSSSCSTIRSDKASSRASPVPAGTSLALPTSTSR